VAAIVDAWSSGDDRAETAGITIRQGRHLKRLSLPEALDLELVPDFVQDGTN
jgi:hypothetical protein